MLSHRLTAMILAGLVVCSPKMVWSWQLPSDSIRVRQSQSTSLSDQQPTIVTSSESFGFNNTSPNSDYADSVYIENGFVAIDEGGMEVFGALPERSWWQPQSFTGQMVWLSRSRGSDESLLLTAGVLDANTLLVVHTPAVYLSDLTFPTEIGTRGSVLFGRAGNFQAELSYLGMFDQSSSVRFSETVDETGIFFFDNIFLSTATDITQTYESDLHTAECNLWCDSGWRVQGLIGARWFQQSETLEQLETFAVDNRALTAIRNNLVGGQLGFRTYLFERERLSVLAIAKGGLFSNSVRLDADVQSGGAQLASLQQTDRTTSWAGELNISAVWQITPNFNFHVGYTGLWLTQVALIGDQLNDFSTATGTGTFDYHRVTYQGGHLGLTLAW